MSPLFLSLFLSFSDYLPTYLPIYLSIYLSFFLARVMLNSEKMVNRRKFRSQTSDNMER